MSSPFRRPLPADVLLGLFRQLIDERYQAIVGPVMRAFDISPGGELDTALRSLESLATELEPQGAPGVKALVGSDEARVVKIALMVSLGATVTTLDAAATRISSDAGRNAGRLARALSLGDATGRTMPAWTTPSEWALERLIGYTQTDLWRAFLRSYPEGLADRVTGALARDFASGLGPIASARHLRELATDLPRAAANNKLRTLQLTSMRDATALEYKLNERLIETIYRIATFDGRVCPAYLALHGSRLRPGERVHDHNQGRCTSVAVVRGNPRTIEGGEAWLIRQSTDRQRAILGASTWQDWNTGRVELRDFVERTSDPTFGEMLQASSLASARRRAAARRAA